MLGPEEGTHDILGGVVPTLVGAAFGIGVREEDDAVVLQRDEFVDLHFAHASSGCKRSIFRVRE